MKRLSMIFLTVLTISTLSQTSIGGEDTSRDLNDIVSKIARKNILMGDAVGVAGVKPGQYTRFERLQRLADEDDLRKLTDHKNGVVRSYAYWALVERESTGIFSILLSHLRDTDKIMTQFCCPRYLIAVGDFFINIAREHLSEDQIAELDNRLIFENNIELSAKNELLRYLKPNTKYYDRLMQIIKTEYNPFAIIALARFRVEKDIKYILSLFLFKNTHWHYLGLTAIREFPHPKLFSLLVKMHEIEIKRPYGFDDPKKIRMMYKAIVQYKDKESLALLQKTIEQGTPKVLEYHVPDIWLAIDMYPDEIYREFKVNLKLSKHQKDSIESASKIEE
jgi:hypothetical protein